MGCLASQAIPYGKMFKFNHVTQSDQAMVGVIFAQSIYTKSVTPYAYAFFDTPVIWLLNRNALA